MKKYIFLLGLLCSISLSNAQKIVELSNPVTNGKANFSCNGFLLKPGFSFKAATNNSLSFGIDKLTCTNWVNNITAYDTDGYPNGYNIDKQRLVGEIPFENTVTPTGAVSYNVPVEIYPGRNSLQPNILLAYNGMGGNSVAGMGWNIGGLSAITPVNSNIYYDGKTAPITLDGNAVYALDGMRLVKQVGSTNLESEQGNIIVVPKTNYFEVRYPNGNKAIYGYTTSTSPQLSYPITRMEDCLGNYIDYQYIKDNNIYYISEINYGASTTDKHYASVKFVYTGREDITPFYSAGLEVKQTKLLTRINSYFNSTLLKSYLLRHELKDVSLLRQIDCLSNGQTINPLVFHYGNNKKHELNIKNEILDNYIKQPSSSEAKGKVNIIPVKFSINSGRNGLIIYPRKNNYLQHKYGWFFSEYNTLDTAYIYSDITKQNQEISKLPLRGEGEHFRELLTLDFDGSGKEYIVTVTAKQPGWKANSEEQVFEILDNKLKSLKKISINTIQDLIYISKPAQTWNPLPKTFLVGNFTGQGKSEVLFFIHKPAKSNYKSKAVCIDLNLGKSIYDQNCLDINIEDILFSIDYNGDGKTDICLINSSGLYVYDFDIQTGLKELASDLSVKREDINPYRSKNYGRRSGGFSYEEAKKTITLGDLNGDGKTDIMISPKGRYCEGRPQVCTNDNVWKILYSKGTGDFSIKEYPITEYNESDECFLQDINGDGYPDLIQKENGTSLNIFYNKNGTFSKEHSILDIGNYQMTTSEILNSNETNILIGINDKNLRLISVPNTVFLDKHLTSSITSTGVINKYYYSTLLENSVHNISGGQFTFPYNKFATNLNVVGKIESKLDNKLIASTSYKYTNATIHRQGLGFRGFEQITTTDNIRNITSTQKFDPRNYSQLIQEDTPFKTVDFEYEMDIKSNKTARINTLAKTEYNKLTGFTSYYYALYDDYGNLGIERIDHDDPKEIGTLKHIVYQNTNNESEYLVGLPTGIYTANWYGDEGIIQTTVIDYKHKNLPNSKKEYYSNTNFNSRSFKNKNTVTRSLNNKQLFASSSDDKLISTETYLYNTKWELTESQTKAYESTKVLTNKFAYDTYGRLVKETDPLGMATEKVFGGNGLLSYTKNYKGKTTKFEYDAFGRVTKTTYPDNTIETSKITWTSSPSGALYVATTTASGQPATQVYYDALGREIRKGQMRFDGKYLYTDNEYNRYGQLYRTSLPFKGGAPTKWNTYTYDNYDRITALKYASGKEDTYSYNKNTITSIIDDISTTKTHDALGQAISVKDPAGTITYNYRADGQYTSIVAPKATGVTDAAVTTSFEYDDYGRQIKLVDPSAGTRSYAYDADGNISKETDADSRVTSMTYDSYNRLKTKTSAGLTTTYTYDAVNGLLMSASNTNRTLTYVYDKDLDRLQSEKEAIVDGKWLQKSYSYSGGNITATTYTSQSGNIVTENYIYTNGHNTEIKLNNTTSIWKLTGENNMGLASNANTGILARAYGYDDYGLPTSRIVKNGSVAIQNFGYEFNPLTGNLNWRKDNNRNIQETFGYDGLNRLTSVNGRASYTLTYDVMGNIKSHSAIGSFDYQHPNKPYAITGATSNIIPAKNQKIDYNAMLRPVSITENGYNANLSYGEDGERIKMELTKDKVLQLKRYYLGGQYEVDEGIAGNKERLYLGGDAYSAAAVYVKLNGKWEVQYICRDYLGSITHVTNSAGTVLQELSYDAWGRLRNPADQVVYAVYAEPTPLLGRGYTGHEHLTMFGLINMNARLYDPVVGRFLSPDPYVQAPWMSQNFNRYSYGLNNPLRYNDPNGEFWHIVVGAVVGGIVNLVTNWDNIKNFGHGLSLFTTGALAGAGVALSPGSFAVIAGSLAASNNVLNQGFHYGFNNIDYQQAAFDGIVSGATAAGIGKLMKMPFVSKVLNKITGNISSPLLRNVLNGQITGTTVGGVTGASMAAINREDLWKGSWKGMKSGFVVGTINGIGNAAQYSIDNKVGFFTGAPSQNSKNSGINIQFGNNANQEYHTFRHTDELGLNRAEVKTAVEIHLEANAHLIEAGRPFNQIINYNGQNIQYTGYKLPNGTINVGRIHGVK